MPKNHYEVLGVNQTATGADIKKAYRNLAKSKHPDKGGSNEDFLEIQNAYETLIDPSKRKEYNLFLNSQQNADSEKKQPSSGQFYSNNSHQDNFFQSNNSFFNHQFMHETNINDHVFSSFLKKSVFKFPYSNFYTKDKDSAFSKEAKESKSNDQRSTDPEFKDPYFSKEGSAFHDYFNHAAMFSSSSFFVSNLYNDILLNELLKSTESSWSDHSFIYKNFDDKPPRPGR